jgi:hypothetical protein
LDQLEETFWARFEKEQKEEEELIVKLREQQGKMEAK